MKKNFWFYEGKEVSKEGSFFKRIRNKFFEGKKGISQSIIGREIFNKYIKKNPENLKLLDIGGAGGHQYDLIPIKDKTRIDIDEDKLKESIGWKTKLIEAEKLDFKEEFDLVSCFQLLEHTKNPLKIMNNIYKSLKKGGKVWITVPDLEAVGFKFYDYYTHIFPFTKKRILFMIKSCGFKVEIIKKYTTPKYWYLFYFFPKLLLKYMLLFKKGSLLLIARK